MKKNAYKNVALVCLGLCALVLGGCASGPTAYDVRGQADPVLNRDVSGKSLSVVVRLYQLKQPTEFSKLAFESLASGRPEADLLGAELIDKSEVVVLPGTQHVSTEMLSENANYLGVVAFFRQPEPQYWRYLIPASQVRSKGVTFRLQDCYIKLIEGKPELIPGQALDAKPECMPITNVANNLKSAPAVSASPASSPAAQPAPVASKPASSSKKPSKTSTAYETGKKIADVLPASPVQVPSVPSTPSATIPPTGLQPSATSINLQLPRY